MLALFLALGALTGARAAGPRRETRLEVIKLDQFEKLADEVWARATHPVSGAVGSGVNDPAVLSERYRDAIDSWQKDPGVGIPDLETARDNFETVTRLSLHQYAEAARESHQTGLASRLASLKLVSIDAPSTRAVSSGTYAADAVFFDKWKKKNVEARLTADFSDPHWHLSRIELITPAAPAPPRPAEPSEPRLSPREGFEKAVRAYVALNSSPGKGFPISDRPARDIPWRCALRAVLPETVAAAGPGLYTGQAEFLDSEQKHLLRVEFLVSEKEGFWRVEKDRLKSVDGVERHPPETPSLK